MSRLLRFRDGTLFRVEDVGSITTMADGTVVANTCAARSIAHSISMTISETPATNAEFREWVETLECMGEQIDINKPRKRRAIEEGLALGMRLVVYQMIRQILEIVSVYTCPGAEAHDMEAHILYERNGTNKLEGHFQSLIPVDIDDEPDVIPTHDPASHVTSFVDMMEAAWFKLKNGLEGRFLDINALGEAIRDDPEGVEIIYVPCRAGKTPIMTYRIMQAFDAGRTVLLFLHHDEIKAATMLYDSIRDLLIKYVKLPDDEVQKRIFHIHQDKIPKPQRAFLETELRAGVNRTSCDGKGRCIVVTLNPGKIRDVKSLFNWNDVDQTKLEIFIDEPQTLWTGRTVMDEQKVVEKELDKMLGETLQIAKLKLVSATHLDTTVILKQKFKVANPTFTMADPDHLDRLGYKGLQTEGFIVHSDPGFHLANAIELWQKDGDKFRDGPVLKFFEHFQQEASSYALVIGEVFAEKDHTVRRDPEGNKVPANDVLNVHKCALKFSKTLSEVVCVGISAKRAVVYIEGSLRFDANQGASPIGKVFEYLQEHFPTARWIITANRADAGSVDYRLGNRTITHVLMCYRDQAEVQRKAQGVGRAFGYNIPHPLHVLSTRLVWDDFKRVIIDGQKAIMRQYKESTITLPKAVHDALTSKKTRFGCPKSIAPDSMRKRSRPEIDAPGPGPSSKRTQVPAGYPEFPSSLDLRSQVLAFFDHPNGRYIKEMKSAGWDWEQLHWKITARQGGNHRNILYVLVKSKHLATMDKKGSGWYKTIAN